MGYFKSTIFEVANVHAPPISVRQKADERERDRVHKLAIKRNDQLHWSSYRCLRNSVTSKLRIQKQKYFSTNFQENEGKCKETWKNLKQLLGKNNRPSENNLTRKEAKDKSNIFNQFFVSVGKKLTFADRIIRQLFMRWMIPQNHLHQFQIQLITAEDVEKVLKVLKVKKETAWC